MGYFPLFFQCWGGLRNPGCIGENYYLLGLLRVSEYSDIHGSNKKFEYEYSSLPKMVDRDLFFFFFFNN